MVPVEADPVVEPEPEVVPVEVEGGILALTKATAMASSVFEHEVTFHRGLQAVTAFASVVGFAGTSPELGSWFK